MRPFVFEEATDLKNAARLGRDNAHGQTDARVQYLAGGTTLIDLMKLDVLQPERVVYIGRITGSHGPVALTPDGLRLDALAKMSQVAEDQHVLRDYPVIAQSLQLAASSQLRNMASLGGNVLQRTRCPYYRDTSWSACNKRIPGSGCAAITGVNRNHAVLGVDESCISHYAGDFAVALVALDAQVEVLSSQGYRRMLFSDLHTAPNGQPHIETTLRSGDIITAFHVPRIASSRRSLYLKIRDRASYQFAIASAAVALDMHGETVREARIGLGGIAYRPWRAHEAERVLVGTRLTEAVAEAAAIAALASARTHGGNDHKPDLARRTLVRALQQAKTMEIST